VIRNYAVKTIRPLLCSAIAIAGGCGARAPSGGQPVSASCSETVVRREVAFKIDPEGEFARAKLIVILPNPAPPICPVDGFCTLEFFKHPTFDTPAGLIEAMRHMALIEGTHDNGNLALDLNRGTADRNIIVRFGLAGGESNGHWEFRTDSGAQQGGDVVVSASDVSEAGNQK